MYNRTHTQANKETKMGFISRTATENETTTAPKIFRQVVSAKPAMTINEIISRELTVADFTDSEILDLAYGIKFADMPGQYWNTVARPQFLARLHALEAAKPSVNENTGWFA
jgi:hypothetical protein